MVRQIQTAGIPLGEKHKKTVSIMFIPVTFVLRIPDKY